MTKVADCARWLHGDYLQTGPKPVKDVESAAKAKGFGVRTLQTAKARARVKSVRKGGVSYWMNTTEVLIDQGSKPDNLVSAILELAAAIREHKNAPASAPRPTPPLLWDDLRSLFDIWTDEDYATSPYHEVLDRVMELNKELIAQQSEHGKTYPMREKEDRTKQIKELEEEIALANTWAEKKFSE
jgi:hypothetical protein